MITDVPGIRVGHWTDLDALTGCTVILPPDGTTGSVDIPGNAPATRETDVIAPGRRVDHPNAILLTGGSAFGLAAADGVMTFLEEKGVGHQTPWIRVPIVPTAAIFDLALGSASVRPGAAAGYAACATATMGPVAEGNVGAGTGATVGKSAGPDHWSKGGLGTASAREGSLIVGAITAVNAVGDVIDDDGAVIAGARADGTWEPPTEAGVNTTIACLATNASLDKEACHRVARAAGRAMGRAIRPAHTPFDGDAVFALATNEIEAPRERVEALAAEAMVEAIRRAVRAADDVAGVPALGHR